MDKIDLKAKVTNKDMPSTIVNIIIAVVIEIILQTKKNQKTRISLSFSHKTVQTENVDKEVLAVIETNTRIEVAVGVLTLIARIETRNKKSAVEILAQINKVINRT